MAGPTVRRRQLGIELAKLRESAHVTQDDAANAIGCSQTKIAHVEIGRNVPSKSDLIVLLQRYGADREHLDVLEDLRQEASKKGWWSTARLPEWLAAYVGLEADATSLSTIQLELIPGLLQTEEYARKLGSLGGHLTSADEVERRVVARIRRQERLREPQPLRLSAVVSEAALQRCLRQTDVAGGQMQHLHEQAEQSNIELHVLPFDAGLHGSMTGAFSLLRFPNGTLPDMVYQEYAVGGHVVDDDSVVARLDMLYNEIRGQALGVDESLAILADLV